HGYIGASPEKVSLTFPIRLFEVYQQVHRACPRFSLGALSTTLTNLQQTPQQALLAEQLSTAYNAYLEIMREVDVRVHEAMGRNAAWYIRHVCAPCMYKTHYERPLRFSWLGTMDGNNSLKLVDATFLAGDSHPDNRASILFRWLTAVQGDVFKDEVANSQKTTFIPAAESVSSTSAKPLATPADIELTKCTDICVERWKVAGPEARKKMFTLFAVLGIFLIVCRHRHVGVMCDMIQSGEL
ncbi:hypothetical protein B0H14DRAFT_2391470, partial [Mycena olivaceomarginata]